MEKPFVIGITGGSGSGKTTFIKKLRESFAEDSICLVSQDDYYRPRAEQKTDENGIKNFDLPYSILQAEFEADVAKLIAGESISRMEYAFNNELATPKELTFKSAPIIIVEGLFIFHYEKVRNALDLKVYLHAKENLKVIRRIKRDKIERNYPLDDVLYRYEHHVLPAFEQYIQPYIEDADLIINNNKSFQGGLDVMTGFVKSKLGTK